MDHIGRRVTPWLKPLKCLGRTRNRATVGIHRLRFNNPVAAVFRVARKLQWLFGVGHKNEPAIAKIVAFAHPQNQEIATQHTRFARLKIDKAASRLDHGCAH